MLFKLKARTSCAPLSSAVLGGLAFTLTLNAAHAVIGPSLAVDAAADIHPISEYIYGMNYADEALAKELRLPVRRWGGNATSRYNFKIDVSNRGSDWFFENIPEGSLGGGSVDAGALPSGSSVDRFVEQDRRTGSKSLLTIPMSGWVAKRRPPNNDHPFDCGFKVSVYGPQQQTDPWDADCGNGVRPDGSLISGNSPGDTSLAIGPEFVREWIAHLVSRFDTAARGGVAFYNLDNEPELWRHTHRDIRPQPLGYDELRDRTFQYAAAIKAVDPSAKTLGPAGWGWNAYFYSDKDTAGENWWEKPLDRLAHGDQPFVEWYLQQMRGYEQRYGVRILDYLDEHIYPQAPGVLDGRTDEASNALRLRSTRSLWDASYVDESWIKQPVRLIPRLREWVDAHYPGTKIAISEYNWGALNHISGALAQADILGIFGRERLDFATVWAPPKANEAAAFAFRMYRNYDGQGNGFGNVAFKAVSADQDKVAIYAARQGNDGPMTLMVINKTPQPQTSTVKLSGYAAAASAQVYRYSGASPDRIVPAPDQPIAANTFAAELPPYSISLYRIAPAATGGDRLPEGCGSGGILREVWTGIGGAAVTDLSAAASFKSAPSASSRLARFQAPSNTGDNFGARIRGTLCTKTSGSYTFWIASDDASELWLSTSDKPDRKRLIARSAAWVSPLQWDKSTSQKSVAIALEAGRHYYIEALHKEGASADHLAVAWQGPGFARQLIDGPYLSPSAIVTPPPPGSSCKVAYVVGNQWQNGFTADVSITNTGSSPINGWTLQWEFPGNQRVGNAWNAAVAQSGSGVTARNAAWNAALAPGSSAGFGFQGAYTGSNPSPARFTLNGTVCAQ